MKVLLISLLMTMVVAEPPVNQYLPPQQGLGSPSQTYGPPGTGGQRQTDAVFRPRPSPSRTPPRRPSNQYIPPATLTAPASQGLLNQYAAPNPSNQYLPPNQGRQATPSTQYGAPQGSDQFGSQGISNQYLPPSGAASPSSQYRAPVPSSQYGAPGFGGNQQLGGSYDSSNGRGGYDDGNNEPANYSFEYMVKDDESGNDFGHGEMRQGARAVGWYYALLPDGRKQTVEYEADENGYKPKISYEDTGRVYNGGFSRNNGQQGYDNQGPY